MKTTAYYKCNLCGLAMKRKTSGRRTWIPSFCEKSGKIGRLYRTPNKKEMIMERPQLLGGGAELTGRAVEYWGHHWIISGKNHYGDWDVVRFRKRDDGVTMKVVSSIAAEILPRDHPHYAELIPPPVVPRYITCECATCGWQDGIREDCVKDGKANGYCDKCDGERTFNLK